MPFLREDALFSKQVGFLRKAATPPEVKLSEGRRQRLSFFQKAARGEASFRNKFIKPPEVKLLSETSSAIECDRWRHPYLKHLAR